MRQLLLRSRARRIRLAIGISIALTASLVPTTNAGAATGFEMSTDTINFGLVIGVRPPEVVTVTQLGDNATFDAATVSSGFVLVQDLCAGATLDNGGQCILRVGVDPSIGLGSHDGTLTISTNGASTTIPLNVEVATAALAFGGWLNRDALGFTPANSTISLFSYPAGFTIGVASGTDDFTLRVELPDDLAVGSYTGQSLAVPGGARISLSGNGRGCNNDESSLVIHEVDSGPEGTLTHLRASFESCGNSSGVVLYDAVTEPTEIWFGPPIIDLGTVNKAHEPVNLFAVNLTAETVALGGVQSNLAAMAIDENTCGVSSLNPGALCHVGLTTNGSQQGQTVAALVELSADGVANQAFVIGNQSVSRVAYVRFANGGTAPAFESVSTFDEDFVVDTDFFGTISIGDRKNLNNFAYISMTQARLGPGTYPIHSSSGPPGSLRVSLGSTCAEDGSEMTVYEATWTPSGQIDSFLATFTMTCPETNTVFGLFSINATLGSAIIGPNWVENHFGVFNPNANTRTLRLTNSGDAPGTIDLAFGTNVESAFVIEPGQCQNAEIQPGKFCDQQITFAPMSRTGEPLWATITIGGDDHLFAGMSVVMTGIAPPDWPLGEASDHPPESGYWLLHADGTVTPFGDARRAGDASEGGEVRKIAATPTGRGYWILGDQGQIRTGGDAVHLGALSPSDLQSLRLGEHVVSISPTPTGLGYWIFTSHGRVFRFGDAADIGDLVNIALAADIIDSIATPSGLGVYMIGSDGGVFSLGDAAFAGSVPQVLPGVALNQPIVGVVSDPDGTGYWLVAADGGVFAFDAGFRGSVPAAIGPGASLNQPVNGMVPYGDGYLLVAADGGVFNFSSKPFEGSLGNSSLSSPVVAIAPIA